MKVCDIVFNSVWFDSRIVKQIEEYLNHGCDLSVIGVFDKKYDRNKLQWLHSRLYLVKFSKFHSDNSAIRFLETTINQYKIFKKIVSLKPEVIHANDLEAAIPSFFAAKRIGAKIVYDSHELFVEQILSGGKKSLAYYYYYYFERFIIKRVDVLTCVSHSAAEYFKEKYNVKPIVVTNCLKKINIDLHNITKHDKFEVVNQGLFYEGRGYDVMVEAAKQINNDSVLFVLRGEGKLEQELKNEVNQNGLNNVFFDKLAPVDKIAETDAKSHVGVAITEPRNLNFSLSVSNKLFEYAAAGLPVIMSNIPEHVYLNTKYNFGIIIPDNSAKSLVEAISKLYNDDKLYNLLSTNALKMSQEVNWEKEFERLVSAVEKIMESQ